MTWPDVTLACVQWLCCTFLVWRVGAFFARGFADSNHWDADSKWP